MWVHSSFGNRATSSTLGAPAIEPGMSKLARYEVASRLISGTAKRPEMSHNGHFLDQTGRLNGLFRQEFP